MPFRHTVLSLALLCSLSSCVSQLRETSAREQSEQLKRIPWEQRKTFGKKVLTTLRQAGEASICQPRKAVALYLYALQQLEPHKDSSRWANKSYQLALGSSIELIQSQNLWGKTIETKLGKVTLQLKQDGLAKTSRSFDSLKFANRFSSSDLRPKISLSGKGVALTAHYLWSSQRATTDPYLAKHGRNYPVSATARWSSPDQLAISLFDSRSQPDLAANFTTPLAFAERKSRGDLARGLLNVYRPEKGLEKMGMYCDEPLDPQRIPVVFVHGLASSPYLWLRPTHNLIQNSQIRKNYQFFTYYYPTGFPLSHTAAGLKSELRKLQSTLKSKGATKNADRMTLVGHSMGGILSSAVTRDFTGSYEELYTTNMQKISGDSMSKRAIVELLQTPPLDCVSRAIFIATPHRGSSHADNFVGQFTSTLIKIPKSLFTVSPQHYRDDLTELGRNLFRVNESIDGVQRLKYGNPVLEYNLSKPKIAKVTYHSIIGNRGKKGAVEDSSDGVVTYTSSHLDNAVSELIVPAWHNAQSHPQTSEELKRILLEHLEE